jgi:hypothetical protein
VNLSQASVKSDPEVVKIHTQNINGSIVKRGQWNISERKATSTLTKNLTKDYHSPVPTAKCEYNQSTLKYLQVLNGMKDLATPDKTEKLKEHIQDGMH